jgi:hypothetical protein
MRKSGGADLHDDWLKKADLNPATSFLMYESVL